jgi:putative oxidoreductase
MMIFGHSLGKLICHYSQKAPFADPYGAGLSRFLWGWRFAELTFCSLGLIFGFFTRATVIPLMITMLPAVFIIHADDPWEGRKMALISDSLR